MGMNCHHQLVAVGEEVGEMVGEEEEEEVEEEKSGLQELVPRKRRLQEARSAPMGRSFPNM